MTPPITDDDLDEDLEDEAPPQGEDQVIKDLRRQARKATKLQAELDGYKRREAFIVANVDLDTALGQMFIKAYDGELDPVKIREEAEKVGALKAETPPPPTGQEIPPEETSSTDERRDLASDAEPDSGKKDDRPPDPREAALKLGQEALAAGASTEDAMADGIGRLMQSAFGDKDERATWKPQE